MTTSNTGIATPKAKRWHQRLRRELLWAVGLKLVLLLALKAAFFPQRLSADEAAQGVAQRVASPSNPAHETFPKEKP